MFQQRSNSVAQATLLLLTGLSAACNGDRVNQDAGAPDVVEQPDASEDGTADSGEDAATPGADMPPDATPPTPPSEYHAPRIVEAHGLATSQVCADCHSNDPSSVAMLDDAGREIGFFDLWQATMKANSARDPFFRAVLSAELHRNPEHAELIEATCLRCHAPMGSVASERTDTTMSYAALQTDDDVGQLGQDGVSCVACHAITDANFGEQQSFSGGWTLTETDELYGPHAAPFTRPMQMRAGFVPTEGDHIIESEHCATCHTLFTETILPDGSVAEGKFPEQTPYLEWLNSGFSGGPDAQSCQDCHVPTVDEDGAAIGTRIARRPPGGDFPPVTERSPYGRHLFVGGNTLVPAILRDNRDTLLPLASDAAFDATIAATTSQLQRDTARVTLENVSLGTGSAQFEVRVENRTGHKFPTAYPSRRAWLHVTIRDDRENVLWESGQWNDAGEVDSVVDKADAYEPHHATIDDPAQVQIYQSVLQNSDGAATVALVHAATYAKDNRILPIGYRADHPDADQTAPVGVDGDDDFTAGSDVTSYRATLQGTAATVEVELLYQALGNRWLRDLFEVRTGDVERFRQMWEASDRRPVVVASVSSDG